MAEAAAGGEVWPLHSCTQDTTRCISWPLVTVCGTTSDRHTCERLAPTVWRCCNLCQQWGGRRSDTALAPVRLAGTHCWEVLNL
jgi:hypothetical protein